MKQSSKGTLNSITLLMNSPRTIRSYKIMFSTRCISISAKNTFNIRQWIRKRYPWEDKIKIRLWKKCEGEPRPSGACPIYILSEAEIGYYNVSFHGMTENLHFISVKLVIRPPSSNKRSNKLRNIYYNVQNGSAYIIFHLRCGWQNWLVNFQRRFFL